MRKEGRGYEIALAAIVPDYVALAPVSADARRAVKVKAAEVESVYLRRGHLVSIALVRLDDGSVLTESSPASFGVCHHGRREKAAWRHRPDRCADCRVELPAR